jgi:PKD repeat protein
MVANAVVVRLSCVPVAGLGIDYAPMPAIVQQAATFTATYTAGTPVPTFAWSFDGGAPVSGQGVVYTFTTTGTHTVTVTATNTCGSTPYSTTITVQPRRIYLPIVLRKGS